MSHGCRCYSQAMYPAPMGHTRDEMPLLWTDEEWAAAEAQQAREPIFVAERFAAQMAAQAGSFQTDGYLVLEDVMTDAASWPSVVV